MPRRGLGNDARARARARIIAITQRLRRHSHNRNARVRVMRARFYCIYCLSFIECTHGSASDWCSTNRAVCGGQSFGSVRAVGDVYVNVDHGQESNAERFVGNGQRGATDCWMAGRQTLATEFLKCLGRGGLGGRQRC